MGPGAARPTHQPGPARKQPDGVRVLRLDRARLGTDRLLRWDTSVTLVLLPLHLRVRVRFLVVVFLLLGQGSLQHAPCAVPRPPITGQNGGAGGGAGGGQATSCLLPVARHNRCHRHRVTRRVGAAAAAAAVTDTGGACRCAVRPADTATTTNRLLNTSSSSSSSSSSFSSADAVAPVSAPAVSFSVSPLAPLPLLRALAPRPPPPPPPPLPPPPPSPRHGKQQRNSLAVAFRPGPSRVALDDDDERGACGTAGCGASALPAACRSSCFDSSCPTSSLTSPSSSSSPGPSSLSPPSPPSSSSSSSSAGFFAFAPSNVSFRFAPKMVTGSGRTRYTHLELLLRELEEECAISSKPNPSSKTRAPPKQLQSPTPENRCGSAPASKHF
uniref:Uncharacterized protein n=1 Tax=Anopheles merus TaxID=30066 RepID=A0A182UUY8_ANOME